MSLKKLTNCGSSMASCPNLLKKLVSKCQITCTTKLT
ncbi:unnamed protein product [Diabrotica balteata]|uniref:Uncharacterized protein n=1 Tax=Diabrotica balteata TaxID=107213 RepID=A0A9N9X7I9_DIABA|nr:unnamed protein product [Diabrotica balteata]